MHFLAKCLLIRLTSGKWWIQSDLSSQLLVSERSVTNNQTRLGDSWCCSSNLATFTQTNTSNTHTHCAVRLYMKQYRIAVEKFIQTCYKSICLNVSYHSRCAKSMCSKQAICTSSQLQQQHLRASNERNKQSLRPNTIEEKDHSIITIVGCRTAVTIKSCYCWIPSFSWQNVVTCTTISVVGWQQHTLHHSSDSTMYRCMLQNYSNY